MCGQALADLNSRTENIQWLVPPANLPLADNEIHVWAASLAVSPADLARFATFLSSDETERAGKFKFDRHRNRFIAGRGILRELLGRYLKTNPAQIDFSYAERGKPGLTKPFASAKLHFNLAHSENLALLAITSRAPVGVDVEHIRSINNVEDLVARFFSTRENELFQKLSAEEKPRAFFNLWTRKEALLKATGEGIGQSLKKVEVSFLSGESARLLDIVGEPNKASAWTLQELSPAKEFIGAIAIQAQGVRVLTMRFAESAKL
jgi:4'-phosphopantetheinyl transferase